MNLPSLLVSAEAYQAYGGVVTGEEHCRSLRRAQEIWDAWKAKVSRAFHACGPLRRTVHARNEQGRGIGIESTPAAYVQDVLARLWAPQFKRISEADEMSHHLPRDLTQSTLFVADFSARERSIG